MISPYDMPVPDYQVGNEFKSGRLKIGDHLFTVSLEFVDEVVLTKKLNDGHFEVTPVKKGFEPFLIPSDDWRWQPTLQRALYQALHDYQRMVRDGENGIRNVKKLIERFCCSYYPCFVKKPPKATDKH